MPHLDKIRTRTIFTLGLAVAVVGLMSWRAVPSHVAVEPCTTPAFTAPTNFAVGPQPYSVAVGDFNGDGISDLVTANRQTNNPIDARGVSVLLGTGTGSFGVARHFAVGPHGAPINFANPEPQSVAAGDFNHDGKSDIVTANTNPNDVSVLLSVGGGDFQDAHEFNVGIRPTSVAIGDFNGDGNSDIITANNSGPGVSTLLGNGVGGFGPATTLMFGTAPNFVAAGDFNGDGKDDLAVTDASTVSNLSILISAGSGGFEPVVNYPIGTNLHSVAISDFNGDGHKDLAVADFSGGTISILLGTGTGSFVVATSFGGLSAVYFVTVGDFNGDGKVDLTTTDLSDYFLGILLGTGTGTFGPPTFFVLPVGSGPRSIATGDFNRDGISDLATSNSGSNSVSVLLSTCINSDTTPPVLTVPSTITVTATGPAGAVVTYSVTATDNLDPNPVISCTPQSGSTFPIGSTSVNCTATDASNNSASDSFTVVVAQAAPSPTPPPPTNRDSIKGVAMGPVTRQRIYYKENGNYLPLDGADEYGDIKGPDDLLGPDGRYPNTTPNIQILNDSKTGWVRLWADWPTFQPSEGDLKVMRGGPTDPTVDDFRQIIPLANIESDPRTKPFLDDLDGQIIMARQQKLKIILTTYRFPLWLRCPAFFPGCLSEERDSSFRVPNDLSKNGAWGQWLRYLVERYGYSDATKDSGRYIDFLEVCNEPNQQMWPQREGDRVNGRIIMARSVAQMFETAQQIVAECNAQLGGQLNSDHPTTISLAGPATADIDDPKTKSKPEPAKAFKSTGYDVFTRKLLEELADLKFNPKSYFAWSHHNYRDIEDDRASKVIPSRGELPDPNYDRTNSAAWVRQLLVVGELDRSSHRYKWTGWPRSNNPELLIDEGGARLYGLIKKYHICPQDINGLKRKQATLLENNFRRMDRIRLGQGIAMVSNYPTYTDPCSDTGLFDFVGVCESKDRPSDAPLLPLWKDRADNCKPSPQSNPDRWFNKCYPSHNAPNPLPRECTGALGAPRRAYETWKRLRSSP